MNLIGERVRHSVFGAGVIAQRQDGQVTVVFDRDGQSKTFCYPQAFEHFLTLEDAASEEKIKRELESRAQIEAQMRKNREEQWQDRQELAHQEDQQRKKAAAQRRSRERNRTKNKK